MRVLHLDSGREMRGGQWQVLSLLTGLGNGNALLTAAEGPLLKAARERGIEAEPLNMMSLAAAVRRADLVHAHDARCHTWAAALGASQLVVSRRVSFPPGQSVLSRWKYGRPRRYLAVSNHVRETLVSGGVPGERIEVVYDGVAVPDSPARGARILAPATDDAMKGADLTRSAARLAGVDVQFSTDLDRDLHDAALLVYCTRSEGLGSAALLAMAHGVPVVASKVGGLPEIVVDGVTGILTENQPEAVAAAIATALDMREELGRNARRLVEERFSLKHMVEATRRVYSQVL
ncbi:MAG TPA: glycosyltransferase family 4 protein [Bryobacteraceae bacterium]|nr:glycosyltransferase family 4 protein [Bryobacteraceae bacterium]